jgi:hypothetical protein
MADPTDTAIDQRLRPALIGIGGAVLFIREITSDPTERLALIRQLAASMAAVVNDPTWGKGFLS